jgi:hypothetical protein
MLLCVLTLQVGRFLQTWDSNSVYNHLFGHFSYSFSP